MKNETKGKFLRDLNLQVGDVVECVGWTHDLSEKYRVGKTYTIKAGHPKFDNVGMCAWWEDGYLPVYPTYQPKMLFKIVSKAPTKTFGELSPEEKGALLLAHHEGEIIECNCPGGAYWKKVNPLWLDNLLYRVKPKPEIKENTLCTPCGDYLIKYNTVDGVPDTNNIKMEKV